MKKENNKKGLAGFLAEKFMHSHLVPVFHNSCIVNRDDFYIYDTKRRRTTNICSNG